MIIDIVTTVKNANEDAMLRTMGSLSSQSTSINWIIVDASDDDSLNDWLIKRHEPEFTYIHRPGESIYSGMNTGIRAGEGEGVLILNVGDELMPGALDEMAFALDSGEADGVFGAIYLGESLRVPRVLDSGIYLHNLNLIHNAALIRRSLYDANDVGLYDANLKICADADWIARAFSRGKKVLISEKLFVFMETGGASDGSSSSRRKIIISDHVRRMKAYFPDVSERLLESIYLYRFNESQLTDKLIYELEESITANNEFKESVAHAFQFIWKWVRPIEALTKADFVQRCKISKIVFQNAIPLLSVVNAGEALAQGPFSVHIVGTFSRKTETFLSAAIEAVSEASPDESPLIVCNFLTPLATERYSGELVSSESLRFHFSDLSEQDLRSVFPGGSLTRAHFHFATIAIEFSGWLEHCSNYVGTGVSTHGIDVRDLEISTSLRERFESVLRRRPRIFLTSPSRYLSHKLERILSSASPVAVVGNPVKPWKSQITVGDDKVRLLHIARPIKLKGHSTLIESIRILMARGIEVSATCILGVDEEHQDVKDLKNEIQKAGLKDVIEIRPYFDFTNQASSLKANIFVSTSLDDGRLGRSETFGMANVEAAIAGLPLVISDAGAQKETLLNDGRIPQPPSVNFYDPGNAAALADGIMEVVRSRDGKAVSSGEYSNAIRDLYCAESYADKVLKVSDSCGRRKKIVNFTSSVAGGAGASTLSVHESFAEFLDVDSYLVKFQRWVTSPSIFTVKVNDSSHLSRFDEGTIISHSDGGMDSLQLKQHVAGSNLNIINWTRGLLSNEAVGYLSWLDTPLVIVLRDYQHLTGGCHYLQGCNGFTKDCAGCPQVRNFEDRTKVELTLSQKKSFWNLGNITWVALSNESEQIARSSPLVARGKLVLIPNSLSAVDGPDTSISKDPKSEAMDISRESKDEVVVTFIPSYAGFAKGTDLFPALAEALRSLANERNLEVKFLLNGNIEPSVRALSLDYELIDTQNPKEALRRGDLTLVLSREETFSRTILESLEIGTPVLSQKTGVASLLTSDNSPIETFNSKEDWYTVADRALDLVERSKKRLLDYSNIESLPSSSDVAHAYVNLASPKPGTISHSRKMPKNLKMWELRYRVNHVESSSTSKKQRFSLTNLKRLNKELLKSGFRQLISDPGLFIRNVNYFLKGR